MINSVLPEAGFQQVFVPFSTPGVSTPTVRLQVAADVAMAGAERAGMFRLHEAVKLSAVDRSL